MTVLNVQIRMAGDYFTMESNQISPMRSTLSGLDLGISKGGVSALALYD
jgi:hypothetical protein